MRKSTPIILALLVLPLGVLGAQEDPQDGQVGSAPAAPQQAPLLLAAALPTSKTNNPVQYLPGMPSGGAIAATASLPQPVIADVTNYPNPFDSRKAGIEGTTVISYQLTGNNKVTLTLYDLLGHKVREWDFAAGSNGGLQGTNTVSWDGTNEAGQKVSKGGYLAEIVVETPQTTATVIRKIGVIH